MVYSVIYLTVESSCRNCFYYHPMAGDTVVLLGKLSLKTFGVVFYAGKNLHYLNWMMVGWFQIMFGLDATTLFDLNHPYFQLRKGVGIMHYFVTSELEFLGTY